MSNVYIPCHYSLRIRFLLRQTFVIANTVHLSILAVVLRRTAYLYHFRSDNTPKTKLNHPQIPHHRSILA